MPEKISLCSNWISKNIKDSAKKLKTPKLIKIYIPFPLKKNTKYKEQNKKTKKKHSSTSSKKPSSTFMEKRRRCTIVGITVLES